MISRQDLRRIARARLKEAEVLLSAGQYDGAVYLCGYAVEVALKARICRHLKWAGFPQSSKEFDGLQALKTHDFKVLIKFTGMDDKVRQLHFQEWNLLLGWTPEVRYAPIGTATRRDAEVMIESARILMGIIR